MKRSGFLSITLLALLSFFVVTLTACQKKGIETTPDTSPKTEQASDTKRKVTDMRGVEVSLPDRINRVAIIDKGSVLQTMTALGVADKIVSSGDFTDAKERDSLVLKPDLLNLPNLGYPMSAVDYETLARSKPDIVILRNSEYIKENQITKDAINKIENDLKIPLVVVNGGGYKDGGYEKNLEGIKLLGKVFSKEKEADEIVKVIESKIDLIKKRTMSVPENKRPSVMFISGLKDEKLTGTIWGNNNGDAKFSESICNIKNVMTKNEALRKVSAEQIISLNPDVIILCTISGPPDKIMNDPAYAPLANVNAIKNKRVYSRGMLTWWGDFRLELPVIMMVSAAGTYPEQFKDIDVNKWIDDYHKEIFKTFDDATILKLRESQELN